MIRRPPRSTLFPYTTPLPIYAGLELGQRVRAVGRRELLHQVLARLAHHLVDDGLDLVLHGGRGAVGEVALQRLVEVAVLDRKSTRLNSSHANISYAVFCLKKK